MDGWIAAWSAVIAGVVGIAAYLATRRFSALQAERDRRRAWMDFDLQLLGDEPLLDLVDERICPEALERSLEARRWRWVCYAIRNPLENYYMSIHGQRLWLRGRVCRSPRFHAMASILRPLVADPEFMGIVRGFSADPSFRRLCENIRNGTFCQAERATRTSSCARRCYARTRSLA